MGRGPLACDFRSSWLEPIPGWARGRPKEPRARWPFRSSATSNACCHSVALMPGRRRTAIAFGAIDDAGADVANRRRPVAHAWLPDLELRGLGGVRRHGGRFRGARG